MRILFLILFSSVQLLYSSSSLSQKFQIKKVTFVFDNSITEVSESEAEALGLSNFANGYFEITNNEITDFKINIAGILYGNNVVNTNTLIYDDAGGDYQTRHSISTHDFLQHNGFRIENDALIFNGNFDILRKNIIDVYEELDSGENSVFQYTYEEYNDESVSFSHYDNFYDISPAEYAMSIGVGMDFYYSYVAKNAGDDPQITQIDLADRVDIAFIIGLDTDGDSKIDELDIDDDNDGIADSYDPFPLVYDVSENVPSSLSGYVEIFFSDYYPSYGVWYGSGENSSINIFYDGGNEFRFEDSYTWDNESLTSTGYNGGGTFRTNFKTKTNDLFFKFTYVSESSELYADDSGKGFFYDGRIDLDSNGMADGEQITNGLPFPAADSIIDLANVYSSAESNLIPIQVLDYASNEKYFASELKDLRPGSTMIEVTGNQATLQFQMEESSDLQTWEDTGTPATMTIPADTDTKFFRFKMAE